MSESVLIVGVGSGLSASLARLCFSKGMKVNFSDKDKTLHLRQTFSNDWVKIFDSDLSNMIIK